MKKLYLLTTALLVISLTSMMLIEKSDKQETKPIEMEKEVDILEVQHFETEFVRM